MQEIVNPVIIIESPSAGTVIQPGQVVRGAGYAFVRSPIVRVGILLGGRHVNNAMFGLRRSELSQDYAGCASADAPGFVFAFKVPDLTDGLIMLEVRVSTESGTEYATPVQLLVSRASTAVAPSPGSPAAASTLARPGADAVKLMIDEARVNDRSVLKVTGWIVSLVEVKLLELYVGDALIGLPERGLKRNDVWQLHADYPDSDRAGFVFVQEVDPGAFGDKPVRVVATALGGFNREATAPIEYASSILRAKKQDVNIHFHCDQVRLSEGGSLIVEGWAVCGAGLRSVQVSLDGQVQGEAALGADRPDVGNSFPHLPDARTAGFLFNKSGLGSFSGDYAVSLLVSDVEGRERTLDILVHAHPDLPGSTAPGGDVSVPVLRVEIDSPAVQGGRVQEPIRGALTVSGWAVAATGIDHLEVFLDGVSLGNAYFGSRREDVQALYPTLPGSLLSGFAISVPSKFLSIGDHQFRLQAAAAGGIRGELEFTVTAQASDEGDGPWKLRSKLPKLEVDFNHALIDRSGVRPQFTVVMPLRNGTPRELERGAATIKSLCAQLYHEWQLCVVIASNADLSARASTLVGKDGRCRSVVADNTTALSEISDTDSLWLLLTPGDILGVDALLEAALAASRDPAVDLFYSDERRFDHSTGRVQPFFKPDWSPDFLLSTNYIGRLWWTRIRLLAIVGASFGMLWRLGEYDLLLRLTEAAGGIGHVPLVLCQAITSKTADRQDRHALQRTMRRQGTDATILQGCLPGVYRVQRAITKRPRISIIIPTIAARGLIKVTIESIRARTVYPDYEIVCVDNIPSNMPDWKKWLRENADVIVPAPFKFNWSLFNNIGAAGASGEYLLFLNDDVEILDTDWLDALLEHAQRPGVAVVGPQLLYPDRKVQHAGLFLTETGARHAFRFADAHDPGPFGLALSQRNVAGVTGACMLMSRTNYERLGRFDETHSVVNNDVDFCLKSISNGYSVIYTPYTSLIHHELASRAKIGDVFNKEGFFKTWHNVLQRGDPFFSRHLSQDYDDYTPEPEPLERLYVGRPLIDRREMKTILAVKLDHIGDFITALPALQHLRIAFPDARICLLAARSSVALAQSLPFVDEVVEFAFFHARSELGPRKLTKKELADLRRQLASYAFDLAIDFRMQPDTRSMLELTGAKWLAGYDHRGRFTWLDIALEWEADTRLLPKRDHVADRLVALAGAVSMACEDTRSTIKTSINKGDARQRLRALVQSVSAAAVFSSLAKELNSPVVCIHPGVGSRTRQWPAEHYASLINLLVEGIGATVIMIGSPDEAPIAQEVERACRQISDALVSLVGLTRVSDLPTILEASDLYVGNNSGPHHLAAALGVRTVGVHSGVVDAREWGPLGENAIALRRRMTCSPCYIEFVTDCHRKMACLRGLRPGDVYQNCLRILAAPLFVKPFELQHCALKREGLKYAKPVAWGLR